MGIAVPQEYKKEAAIGGEWSTVSETPIYTNIKTEDEDGKPTASFGVRKRKLDEDEEEIQAIERKGWGSKFKSYPGSNKGLDDDLDALLSGPIVKKKDTKVENSTPDVKLEQTDADELNDAIPEEATPAVKKEETIGEASLAAVPDVGQATVPVKQEEAAADPPVVFKKRKGKR